MPSAMTPAAGGYLERPTPSSLADVIEVILDKGMVIDAYARVSLMGIEVVTLDARVVVASVDTYLRFAEATNRLELEEHGGKNVSDLGTVAGDVTEKAAATVTEHAVNHAKEKVVRKVKDTVKDVVGAGDE